MSINEDYGYCTGEHCLLRRKCKRYDKEALKSSIPLWWTDGFYDYDTNKCDFMDLKTETNPNLTKHEKDNSETNIL